MLKLCPATATHNIKSLNLLNLLIKILIFKHSYHSQKSLKG